MTDRVVIVGASIGGIRTAEALRNAGLQGEILIVGAEKHYPYDRPELSKKYLHDPEFDETNLALTSAEELKRQRIQLKLGATAVRLDCNDNTVHLDDGSRLAFDHCVIATGASARRGPWPDRTNMHLLRTFDDSKLLRSELQPRSRVAVIGAGFVGAEAASSAIKMGCVVTVIDSAPVPLMRSLGRGVGSLLAHLPQRFGVELRLGVGVTSIEHNASGSRLTLTDGSHVDADVIVVGIGAEPSDAWLETSGLQIEDGLVCDRYCRAIGHPGVYGVGDVARWHHPVYDESVRLEHWTNAVQQAQVVAHNIAAGRDLAEYKPIEYVWSDQYGVKLQFAGRICRAETVEVIGDLSLEQRPQAAIVCADAEGNLVGCATVNWPRASIHARQLLSNNVDFGQACLSIGELRLKTSAHGHTLSSHR